MRSVICTAFPLWLAVSLVSVPGCGNVQPSYPSLSEIPAMQEYPAVETKWNTDAVCWVGQTDEANWQWNLPNEAAPALLWVKNNTAEAMQDLIKKELEAEGYKLVDFTQSYPTRQTRLGIHKLVLFHRFEINRIQVVEGSCYDMKLITRIVDNVAQDHSEDCEIVARCFIPNGQTMQWPEVYGVCMENMRKAPQFRESLQPAAAMVSDSASAPAP